ncbi:ParB family protein [Rathayibacter rathayi]|uniref:ParB family protein n=1 Tax=Rathayibacter rathayi TaxID=33887 RepID=UPI000BD719CE|nr:hypothetical protein [Rathayibacter rathayi]MWV75903.1 hypothetical protein [Rathayibacter rathayi NCPPB 2980 = VKM Ac-1601]SOE05914.1 hypothetical protein SAMN06295924_11815 [Rathayibacter rathayi NCPPB 2980 = VKM Ac-1601]
MFQLVPEVESVVTPVADATPITDAPEAVASAEADASTAAKSNRTRGERPVDSKGSTTLLMGLSLKGRAQTAVLRTQGFDGGYTSFSALVEGAVAREVERLEGEFNNGEPFPAHRGAFRTGRPLGS